MSFIPNIPYCPNDADPYRRNRCLLDLSLPDEPGFPLVIHFHGGGLEEGSKDGDDSAGLARHGIGIVIPSYRLYPQATFPAQPEDAAACIAWAFAHGAEYGADMRSVFVSGHSAGGYLAALVGTDASYLANHGIPLAGIAGIIPISAQFFTHATIRKGRGVPDPWNTPTIDEAAPSYHAGPHMPPTLALCGDDDIPTRSQEGAYFVSLLKSKGHSDAAYMEVAGRTHTSIMTRIAADGDDVGMPYRAFIASHRR